MICGRLLLTAWLLAPLTASAGPAAHFIPDEHGRELVPGGFVAITEDRKGRISYTPEDYRRMVRMGANFQVIRLSLGRLGGWPGTSPDPAYPAQIDDMVRMGREAGLRTVFKLVVYGIRGFGPEQWDALWKNTDGSQDALLEAWRKIWLRYRDDPSVFGYDLLNEPQRGLEPGEQRCVREDLLPTLRRLTDAMQEVSPDKWALYQPLFRHKGQGVGPFAPMTEPLGRDRVIYAPHMYTTDIGKMRETLDRYEREAALSKAPLMLGEWGPSVALTVDSDPKRQAFYTKVYQLTARDLDRRGIGGIKAWFCGSRSPLENKKTSTKYTWAIFSDTRPVGRVERKYLVDPLARPRPLAVAGRLEGFGFNFNAQTLEMNLRPDATLGATEVFVSTDRYYPAGFRVEIGDGLVMALKPGDKQLRVVHSATASDRSQARWVRWDADKLRLVIEKWTGTAPRMLLKIVPLPASNPSRKKPARRAPGDERPNRALHIPCGHSVPRLGGNEFGWTPVRIAYNGIDMTLVEIIPKENFRLFVRYDDGTSGVVDLSAYAGRGVFAGWMEPGVFEQVQLAEAGHPEWPGNIDLCPDALYMQLTGKRPEEVFPSLKHLPAHA